MNSTQPAPDLAPPVPAAKTESGGMRLLKLAVRLLLTAGLLVLLFSQVQWHDVWRVVRALDGSLLVWACLLWLPTQYLQFVRWAKLARDAGPEVSQGDIRRSYWVGFTLGLVTPGRIGQIGRALALHRCPLPRALGVSALERAYSALTMNGLGLLALVVLPLLGWIPPFPLPSAVARGICIAGGSMLLLLGVFPQKAFRPLNWLADRLPLRQQLKNAVEVLALTGPKRGAFFVFLAVAALASALLQFVLLLRAMGAEVPIVAGMLTALLTFFLKGALPITLGSLGIGEWSAVYCFQGLGVEPSVAVAASLLLFTFNVFVPGLIGLPFVHTLRILPWRSAEARSA